MMNLVRLFSPQQLAVTLVIGSLAATANAEDQGAASPHLGDQPILEIAAEAPDLLKLTSYEGGDADPRLSQALSAVHAECPGLTHHDVDIRPIGATVNTSVGETGRFGKTDHWNEWFSFRFLVDSPPSHLPRMWQHHFSIQISSDPAEISADKEIGAWVCDLDAVGFDPTPRPTKLANWPPQI